MYPMRRTASLSSTKVSHPSFSSIYLLGVVDQNMRSVSVEWTDQAIMVSCIFQEKSTGKDLQAMARVKEEMSRDFPKDRILVEEMQYDSPQRTPREGSVMVYER